LNKNQTTHRPHEPRTPASFLELQTLSTLRNADDFFQRVVPHRRDSDRPMRCIMPVAKQA